MKELLNLNKYERINEISVILTNNMNMIPKKLRLISLPWSDELNTIYSIEGLLSLSIYLGSLDKIPEYIINPSTNRKVLLNNKIGQELLDSYTASIYKIISNKQIGGAGVAKGMMGGMSGIMDKVMGGDDNNDEQDEDDLFTSLMPYKCNKKKIITDSKGQGVRIKVLLNAIKFNTTMTRVSKLIGMINEYLD